METLKVTVLEPTFPEAKDVTMEDVLGRWSEDHQKIHDGMVVADHNLGGFDKKWCQSKALCPIFKDFVGYKSLTVVCDASIREEVAYWLEYVHGGDSIQMVRELEDGRVAFRSDYQAW